MKLATAFVEVRPDMKGFRSELEQTTTRDAAAVGKQLGSVLAGGAFLAGAKKATDAASQLEQAVGGTAAVFGEAQGAVEDFAKGAAESAGLSERAARELTSTLGGLLKGFGFTNVEASELSITLAKLGADLAATFGGTPEEAVQALGAALRGETDPLERFGIALNQTLVNQRAVQLGLAATTSSVDQHAKAQATLSLITERSADAQGQFARESDTAAGQAAISAAKMENSAADLGQNLLPIYTKISEVVGVLADGFGALPEPVQTAVIALAGIVALSGPVRLAGEAITSLATIARTALTKSLDTAAVGAYNLAGNLGKMTLGLGAAGAVIGIAAVAFDAYNRNKEEATKRTNELIDAIARERDGMEGEVASTNLANVLKGELGEATREAGAHLDVFSDAITGSSDKLAGLGDSLHGKGGIDDLGDLSTALENAGLAGTALGDELLRLQNEGALDDGQLNDLIIRLGDQATAYGKASREADNKAAADESAGTAAGNAAPKVADLTEKLDINEQAAKDAAESVDLFREAVEKALAPLDFQGAMDARTKALQDIQAGIEDRAEAVAEARRRISDLQAIPGEDRPDDFARQMADAQADLQEALDATSLTLDGNSEAALRNRDQLRGVIDDSVGVIEAARDQGRSLDDLKVIRALEIQSLRDQLTQMGFNEAEVETYIDAIERIPLDRTTVLSVDDAKAKIQLEAAIARLQRQIDLNPLSIDVAAAERFAAGPRSVTGHAAGGDVMDGLFSVGEAGPELMRKDGARVSVLAGGPSPVGFDGVGEEQLLELRRQNELLEVIAAGMSSGPSLRKVKLEAGAI